MNDDSPWHPSRREFQIATAATLALGLTLHGEAHARASRVTVAGYIVLRLQQLGVQVLFGVPGATCDPLYAAAAAASMRIVVTASDLEAGYAADGYARFKGLSAVAVTYGVGTLGLISVVAGALAERSPMVVLNGGPTPQDLRLQAEENTLYSHSNSRLGSDLALFREVTASATRLERAADAPGTIDTALTTALAEQRPVYLEIPKHLWLEPCAAPAGTLEKPRSEAGEVDLVLQRLLESREPLVLVGIEVKRHGLQEQLESWLTGARVPWASTYLAKAVIPEQTPGFLGVYAGSRSVPAVKDVVESADLVLALGTVMGRQYRGLVTRRKASLVRVEDGVVRTSSGSTPGGLSAVVDALAASGWQGDADRITATRLTGQSYDERRASVVVKPGGRAAQGEEGLGYDDLCRAISASLSPEHLVITDTSLSMYPAAELDVKGRDGFLSNAVWAAIGYSVAAAVGASFAQSRRPIVLVGDGGFQMTAQALSTLARHRRPATIIVCDNALYGIEQWLLDRPWFSEPIATQPLPYLALHRWKYVELAQAMGIETAFAVDSIASFESALQKSLAVEGPALIAARIKPHDLPEKVRT